MLHIVMKRLAVDAAHAPAFEAGFTHALSAPRALRGLRRAILLRPTAVGQPCVATMEWDAPASFEVWMAGPSVRSVHAPPGADARAMLGGGNAVERFDTVSEVAPAVSRTGEGPLGLPPPHVRRSSSA